MLPPNLVDQISRELSLAPRQVRSTLELFDDGNTLPFVARYRKEATGGLDEVLLRDVRDRADYLSELEERRAAILESIDGQGKLELELRARIEAAATKQALEDLYLPFKPKRRTRAQIARECGLGPLAELLWSGDVGDGGAERAAADFVDTSREVATVADALQGARDILAERVAEDAELRGRVRELTRAKGVVRSAAIFGKQAAVSKFQDYYDYSERLGDVPSHRMLAIRRGEAEEMLVWSIAAPVDEIVAELDRRVAGPRAARSQLALVAQDAYRRLLAPSIEVEIRLELKTRADEEAIRIFGQNLEQLLLAAPAGERAVLGLDPGFRTGVKVAAVSRTGALLARIEPARYVTEGDAAAGRRESVGLPTLTDILAELRKPGRDPRSSFEPPAFRDDVTEPKDLREGMVLQGIVTNVVAFGCFVDIGVHQDGLVHVSQLSDRYVADPNDVVRVGQKVRVTVTGVDLARNRIALSMKSNASGAPAPARAGGAARGRSRDSAPDARKPEAPRPHESGDVAPNGMRFK